jgi:hypothetical protein
MIVVRNKSIGREVARQISPGTPVSIEIENSVEDFPASIFYVAAQVFGTWEQWL